MNAKKEHRVPLSKRALAILREAEPARNGVFIFPGAKPGEPLSNAAMAAVIKRMNEANEKAG